MKLSRNKIAKLLKSGNQSRKNIKKRRSKTLHNAHLLSADEIILAPEKEVKRRARSAHLHPRPLNLRFKTLKNRVKGGMRPGFIMSIEQKKTRLRDLQNRELFPVGLDPEKEEELRLLKIEFNEPTIAVPVQNTGSLARAVDNPLYDSNQIYDNFKLDENGVLQQLALPAGITRINPPAGADYRNPTKIEPKKPLYAQFVPNNPGYISIQAQAQGEEALYEVLPDDTLKNVQEKTKGVVLYSLNLREEG